MGLAFGTTSMVSARAKPGASSIGIEPSSCICTPVGITGDIVWPAQVWLGADVRDRTIRPTKRSAPGGAAPRTTVLDHSWGRAPTAENQDTSALKLSP